MLKIALPPQESQIIHNKLFLIIDKSSNLDFQTHLTSVSCCLIIIHNPEYPIVKVGTGVKAEAKVKVKTGVKGQVLVKLKVWNQKKA